MKTNRKKKFNQTTRVAVLFSIALFLVVVFLGRLFYLQVVANEAYRQAAVTQRRRSIELVPKRGIIYDRNKKPLAVSVTVNTCYFFPKELEGEERTQAVQILSDVLGVERSSLEKKIADGAEILRVKSKVSQEEIDTLKKSGLTAYSIERESDRYYPNGSMLAQTLGFVNDEGRGVYGLEAYYDELLRGDAGQQVDSRDLNGRVIPTESASRIDAKAGKNLYLTINIDLQRILYEEVEKVMRQYKPDQITAILLDPNNGEILALENRPSFDPNEPRSPLGDGMRAQWSGMDEDARLETLYKLWSNPAVSFLYEPGSVFKALTAAMAIEEKTSKPSSVYVCNGSIEIAPGMSIYCAVYPHSHGAQNLEEALANSCNPAFVQIVRELGAERYDSYARSLHLGDRSGVDLPAEAVGSFPESVEKMESARLATMAYGHGVSVTPLQALSSVTATINGGYYRQPHVLRQVTDTEDHILKQEIPTAQTQVFSQETSEIMREYDVNTVRNGVSNAVDIQGHSVGGKSGTTTKIVEGKYVDEQTLSSFWSFYPANAPKYSLLVVADNPKKAHSGNEVAGSCSRAILERLIEREEGAQLAPENQGLVEVPNVLGMTVEEADRALRAVQLNLSVFGDMGRYVLIESQTPSAGKLLKPQSTVEVRPGPSRRLRIPDFSGKSVEEIERMVQNSGLEVRLQGTGLAVRQSPEPETVVQEETAVDVWLQNQENSGR